MDKNVAIISNDLGLTFSTKKTLKKYNPIKKS